MTKEKEMSNICTACGYIDHEGAEGCYCPSCGGSMELVEDYEIEEVITNG